MVAVAVSVGLFVALVIAARCEPPYYRERMPVAAGDVALARRFVTDAAALQAAIARPGRWDAAFEEREINAWLATDLPANHARLLPAGLAEPRVRLAPGRLDLAIRVGAGVASAVLHLALKIRLRGENQLAVELEEARLGLLPLPRDAVLAEIGRRLGRLGGVTSLRRLDGRSVLVVYIPSTHDAQGMGRWLGAWAIADGSLLVAGETRAGAAPR
jgi:hypothetical protein